MFRPNLKSKRFGKLIVLEQIIRGQDKRYNSWKCACDCGHEITVRTNDLVNGRRKSCGCLGVPHRWGGVVRHGEHRTKLYQAWKNMRRRCCLPPSHESYESYKHVTCCSEWDKSYES